MQWSYSPSAKPLWRGPLCCVLGFLLVSALAVPVLPGQALKPGPQVLTFFSEIDDTDQPYALYLPRNYSASRKYPLVVSLHGPSSNHRLNMRRVFGKGNLMGETDAEATRFFPPLPDVPFIVASPLARGTLGYQGIPEQDVYDVLADVRKRFSIDEDRIYLTGLSMGGGGALWLGLTRPDIWAAIAPVCPAGSEQAADFAPNALNLAVHLFHGSADPVVPVTVSREWKQRLDESGAKVEYTEYPNVRHNSWANAYKDAAIFDWFAQFRRNPFPDRVRFVTDRYKYREAYWLGIDALTPGVRAAIDARFSGPNTIEITTAGLDAFHLNPANHPKYFAARPLRLTIDGKQVAARRGALQFIRSNGSWKQGAYQPPLNQKRAGSEGPIPEVIAQRHVYVYGTLGAAGEEELTARREIAARAAEWGSPRARLLLTFRVVSDQELRPADLESSNVVLFGAKETNEAIAKLANNLPIELNAGAADYGLVFVYPNGPHTIMINSGLPFWTGIERMRNLSPRYLPAPFVLLSGMKDYVLFRGSMENVIVNGTFDRNWRLPAADAAKMLATGAVKLKP